MTLQNSINNGGVAIGSWVTKRQCITQGSFNAGQPYLISSTGALSCSITATTNPIVANFAAGFGNDGAIDYVGILSSDQNYSSLATNTTHYFYLELNSATKVVTTGRITIAPIYRRTAPASPSTGQHWFNTSQNSNSVQKGMTMYEWSGSAWIARLRVFLGEVTTGASAISSQATYAYERRYQSDWLTVATGVIYNFNHFLGMTPTEAEATITWTGRQNSSDGLHAFVPYGLYVGTAGFGVLNFGTGGRLSQTVVTGDSGIYYSGSSWLSIADITCSINSGW